MSDLPATRQSLLLKLGSRDEGAWEEFLDIYENAILGYCIRRGLSENDARDATQEVYAALQKKVSSWDPDAKGSFRAWLFRVARNISLNQLRSHRRDAVVGGTQFEAVAAELKTAGDPASDELSTLFQLHWQRAAFEWACGCVQQEVREVTWQAFYFSAVQGRKPEEVAQQLNLSTGSVYTAKCRVMARIRKQVEQWQDDQSSVNETEI